MSQISSSARSERLLPLDQRFGYRFAMISRALAQYTLLYVEREFGINFAEYRVLSVLAERETPSIRDIAAHTQMDKAHVTRALASLTTRGLASQVVDEGDRRLRMVHATAAGRAIIARAMPFIVERQKRLEQSLTGSELRVLWKALSALSDEANRMLAEEQRREAHHQRPAQKPASIRSRRK